MTQSESNESSAKYFNLEALPLQRDLTEEESQRLAEQAYKAEKARQEAEIIRRGRNLIVVENNVEEAAAELRKCASDFIYWCENYVWLEEPRNELKKIPFLMYLYQKQAATKILSLAAETVGSVKKHDILVEKTRDMGWSWLLVTIAVWLFLFHDKNILFGSEKADKADKLGDMQSLLEKCRYVLRNLPDFMLPVDFRFDKHMGLNLIRKPPGVGSGSITADSANPDFGRGDRKYIIILDEFASWDYDIAALAACGDATKCRIFISTPKGPHNQFAKMARGEDDVKPHKITSHWTQHPIKAAGASMDPDGKPTSPYYREERKLKTPDMMAAEIDICYESSTKGKVFDDFSIALHRRGGLKPDKVDAGDRPTIIRVWDPGMDFFVLFMQIDRHTRVLALREILHNNAHVRDVAEDVLHISHKYFDGCNFLDYGDPAGYTRSQASAERAEFEVLADEYDIQVQTDFMAHVPTVLRVPSRIQAIKNKLNQYIAATKTQAFLIDPEGCPILDRALVEGYRYRVDKYTKAVSDKPEHTHPYCDAIDCLGYGILAELGAATAQDRQNNVRKIQVERSSATWSAWGKRSRFGRR